MDTRSICVIGGTGPEGGGLALRWADFGHRVSIGSRDAAKAQKCAEELNRILGADKISGDASTAALEGAEIAVLTVPYSAQLPTASGLRDRLQGKILIDVTVPLVPPKVSTVQLPEAGSAAVALQKELGDGVRLVSAFQNVSAHKLKKLDRKIDCDVLVTSDDAEARRIGIELATAAGLRGIDCGPLANSAAAEALTSVLIWVNKKYKVPDAGIRISGIEADEQGGAC